MKTQICLLISAIMSAWVPYHHDSAHEQKYWKEFISMYNKQYDGPDATYYRIQAFMKNHKFVAETNSKMQESGRDLRLEINSFADMHFDEFIQQKGGLHQEKKFKNYREIHTYEAPLASVDWRDKGVVNPVKNQQQCGSCWAFSATFANEARWAVKTGELLSLSEQQLVDCDRDQDMGCNGGLMDNAFTYLETHKQELESDYTYTAEDGRCKFSQSKGKVSPTGFHDVEANDDAIARAVSEGPISVAVAANSYWQMYQGGIVTLDDCPADQLDHGVAIVGYTADSWCVRNSWGPSWGESGYIRLSRTGNVCGVHNSASYPTYD